MKRFAVTVVLIGIVAFALASRGQIAAPDSSPAGAGPVGASIPAELREAPQLVSPPPAPPTILESQSLVKGQLVIRGYTDVATLAGDDDSSIRTTAVEITNRDGKFYGVIFTIRQGGRIGREAITYVDEQEIQPLGEAIDAIAHLERGASAMSGYEAHYRTQGNLEITNYDLNGARMVSVRGVQVLLPSGEITWAVAHFSVARVTELRQQLAAAKQTIDKAKTPPAAKDDSK